MNFYFDVSRVDYIILLIYYILILCVFAVPVLLNAFFDGFYRIHSKIWDTQNNYHNCIVNKKICFYNAVMHPKVANGIIAANNMVPGLKGHIPWGEVWSESVMLAETYLSQFLEFLQ